MRAIVRASFHRRTVSVFAAYGAAFGIRRVEKSSQLSGYPIFLVNAVSFSSARALVGGLIQASVPMSSCSVAWRLSTNAFARAFAEGGKPAATYALPSTSRSAASVATVQRSQRGV